MNQHPPDLPTSGKKQHRKPLALTEVPAGMVPSAIQANCAPFDIDTYGEGHHVLYIVPEAYREFSEYVKYGKKRPCNVYEQQYIGLGHNFIDTNRRIQSVVTKIIPIYSASRGPCHANAISENNDAMLDILDNERKIQNQLEAELNIDEDGYTIDPFLEYGPSKVILFGHTHPELSCFFSSVDHRSNYSTPTFPIVTFVCDPIQKDMKAMVGINCESMKIIVCRPKTELYPSTQQHAPASREFTLDELWQRASAAANLLLQQVGVNGSFDCYHDRRGRTHMQFKMIYRPLKRPQWE